MGVTSKLADSCSSICGTSAPPTSTTFLKAWLRHDLSMAREAGRGLAVFVVRIDDYHELGVPGHELETIVAELGSRLRETLRPADAFIRSGEDSFTLFLSFSGDRLGLHSNAKIMLKCLQQPVLFDAGEQKLAASIGIAFYPEDGNSADMLLERAHQALRRTDRWGGNGFCLYSRSAATKIAGDLARHEDFRRALGAGDLCMRFQPILDLARNCMSAVSGDLAWESPEHGSLDMADVAEIAERADILPRFNEWLVDQLDRQSAAWRDGGIQRTISIPLSRSQIADGDLARCLSSRLGGSGLRADLLEMRVDHDLLLDDTDHRFRTGMLQLAELGITLHLSHVGNGPLAFQSIKRLPIAAVSLAPSMIAAIGRCSLSETMLKALIGFGHGLSLGMRAVDIKTREQLDCLLNFGCDEAAGDFLAPPSSGEGIDRLTGFKPCLNQQEKLRLVPSQAPMQ